ncbi:uncharacterized protein LOC135155036 [Lytechinus pictus]|uniref:uncharacterized protein LOC135155036 n=1 Tax=Lytechinus pictus TaxID=7653 RepID=UPI0030B9F066
MSPKVIAVLCLLVDFASITSGRSLSNNDDTIDETLLTDDTIDETLWDDDTIDETLLDDDTIDETLLTDDTIDETLLTDDTIDETLWDDDTIDETLWDDDTIDEALLADDSRSLIKKVPQTFIYSDASPSGCGACVSECAGMKWDEIGLSLKWLKAPLGENSSQNYLHEGYDITLNKVLTASRADTL